MHFPFNLLFPSFVTTFLGAEASIPLEDVVRVEGATYALCRQLTRVYWSVGGRIQGIQFEAGESFLALLVAAAQANGAKLEGPSDAGG